ncbi:MAG: sulfur oxidation c-type cytochrome SoxX [Rhizobiales bacterium]|nr:sulfur oxidation c-type cytochrome SoxX [Hyphomicrobiales bacterium]
MTQSIRISALALAGALALALPFAAGAAPKAKTEAAPKQADPAVVEAYLKDTFGKAPEEWQQRIVPDDTLKTCNAYHNNVPSKEADAIIKREMAKVVYPADGQLLGDWKSGKKIADNGRGGQFSDKPDTVSGGNCYACHQLDKAEVSFGTLGPSLTNYGKDRKFDPAEAKSAYAKIYNSQAFVACSNMPRFGANNVLSEKQIKDLVALLFDPESPVNK